MKNLSNCKPSEFLKQTNLIKKSVEKWLTVTDILNIRRRMPELEQIPEKASDEEKKRIIEANDALMKEQVRKNISDMLDSMLDTHPEETLELLALCCFVDPKEADEHPIREYLISISDLLNDEAVTGFFTSLMRLGQINI